MLRRFSLALVAVAALAGLAVSAPAEAYPAGSIQKQFSCTVTAPGFGVDTNCNNGGFGYVVPAGRMFCMTQAFLSNKFPYDPPGYPSNMRTMYLAMEGFSLPSHHPEITFTPPLAKGPGSVITAHILNGQSEAQNVYAVVMGYETDLNADWCLGQ